MGESALHAMDRELARLKAANPGWRIWYVPHSTTPGATWCAQPLPLLNCGSPEELREEISRAVQSFPALTETSAG